MRASPFIVRATGSGLRTPKNPIRGTDAAGQVEAVGKNVIRLTTGRRGVRLVSKARSPSTSVLTRATSCRSLPTSPSRAPPPFALAGCTALQGLRDTGGRAAGTGGPDHRCRGRRGHVRRSDRQGARVSASPGRAARRSADLVRSLGADDVIDYTQEDFTRGEKRYDLIFQLAGTASPAACRCALTEKGTLVVSSGEGRFAGIDRIVRTRRVTLRGPASERARHEGDERGSGHPRGTRRIGPARAGDRQDLRAERCPRGDLPGGSGARPREGRHRVLRPH